MRRQLGADHVRIDTIEGYAGYALVEPRRLELAALPEAARDAGYTLVAAEVDLEAAVERAGCEACAREVSFLVVAGTGQRLELGGDPPAAPAARLRVRFEPPLGEHVRGRLLPAR